MKQFVSHSLDAAVLVALAALSSCLAPDPALYIRDAAQSDENVRPSPEVSRAIDSVYPALVQIKVLTITHYGGRERKFEAVGSGAIIGPEGYVVTNHHVAGKAKKLKCVLSSREELDATLIGTDPLSDISVLKLDLTSRKKDAPPLPVARFGSSSTLKVGDPVLAMGCPLALSQSVTKGIVSNIDLIMSRRFIGGFYIDGEDVGSLVKWIGHDAQIQPGNSGGPLVNLKGEIVGINEIALGGFIGGSMSGAIPSDLVRDIVDELIEHGKIRRPWFGAVYQPLLKDAVGGGVLVSGVVPGSPAEKAGVRPGDVVHTVNGEQITVKFREELPAFNARLLALHLQEPVTLEIGRPGAETESITVTIMPEARDDARGKEVESVEWGLTVRQVTTMAAKRMRRPDKKGVIVGSVRAGGPADKAEPSLSGGDVIVKVGGEPVESLEAFVELTARIIEDRKSPVPTIVTYDRRSKRLMTLVEVGIKKSQDPTPEVRKAWFAAATQVLSKKLAKALGLKRTKGVRLTQIYPDSEVEKAGFKVGDILTHIDGQKIEASETYDAEVFETMIRAYKIGSTAEFRVIRGGEKMKVASVLSETPKPVRELKVHEDVVLEFKVRDISYFDRIRFRLGKEETGALVTQVQPGGWASMGRLSRNHIIQAVEGRPVTDVKSLKKELKRLHTDRPRHVSILVKRGISTSFLELEPGWPEKPGEDKPK